MVVLYYMRFFGPNQYSSPKGGLCLELNFFSESGIMRGELAKVAVRNESSAIAH